MTAQLYRVGTTPDSPFAVFHLAGIAFPKTTERVEIDRFTGETRRSTVEGDVLELTPQQLDACLAAARTKHVRLLKAPDGQSAGRAAIFLGPKVAEYVDQHGRTVKREVGSRRYKPLPDDKTVADYVYAIPVEETPHGAPARRPTLAETGVAKAPAPVAEPARRK